MNVNLNVQAVVLRGFLPKLVGIKSKKIKNKMVILHNCNDIHSFGLRKNLDLAFVDKSGNTIKVVRNFRPWSRCKCKGAKYVIERYSQKEQVWFKVGDHLRIP